MEDTEFLTLSQLFDSIGIIEKGIERIYHYLLLNKRIEDLKQVCNEFNLSLKRGYKICSVLNDLELVQTYDRPMKVHLATPVLNLWQKLIHKRIEDLQNQFSEKQNKCETSLEEFIKSYKLEEQIIQEPVEFINYDVNNFDETYHSFLAPKVCKIAIGIRYDNPLKAIIQQFQAKGIPDDIKEKMATGMKKIKENLNKIEIQVIFNSEVVKELLESKEFGFLSKHLEEFNLSFKSFNIHVTDEDFSNFGLTDYELIQPSFDPTNILIGSYVSRNKNIYQIFSDKFKEIYEKGIPINQFIKKEKKISLDLLTESQSFGLCIL
ncbi:MAG: hypothetical protein ACFFA6_05700 [Promethearchaeota archaeon]